MATPAAGSRFEPTGDASLAELTDERLFALFYDLLRDLARSQMSGVDLRSITLQPTALVHEAYFRLARDHEPWNDRRHFFGAAANAMRQVLVEHARRRNAKRRGGGAVRIELDQLDGIDGGPNLDMLALDEALAVFQRVDPRGHRIVNLKWFAGLGVDEIAEVLELSPRTVKREWRLARLWLLDRLGEEEA